MHAAIIAWHAYIHWWPIKAWTTWHFQYTAASMCTCLRGLVPELNLLQLVPGAWCTCCVAVTTATAKAWPSGPGPARGDCGYRLRQMHLVAGWHCVCTCMVGALFDGASWPASSTALNVLQLVHANQLDISRHAVLQCLV